MLTIDSYTARFDTAMRPSAPRLNSLVRVAVSPDDREYHGFAAVLRAAGLDMTWERSMPRAKADVFRIVRAR